MTTLLWVTTTLLLLRASQSYILLTANMEDVHSIAKQVLSSPMKDQLGRIWRRAAWQFNQRLNARRAQRKRADDDVEGEDVGSGLDGPYLSDSFRKRGRRVLSELSALSKNASVYLQSLRRAFNEIVKE